MIDIFDTQLHRRQRRLLTMRFRIDLIQRRADKHIGTLCLFRMGLRQKDGTRTKVIATNLGCRKGFRIMHIRIADDGEMILIRMQRGENVFGNIKLGADRRR